MAPLTSVDPRTGAPVGTPFHEATEEDVALAARSAAACFEEIREWPRARMAGLLDAIAAELELQSSSLVGIADRETALGTGRLESELERATGQLRMFARLVGEGRHLEAVIDRAAPSASPPRPDLRRMLIPIGPVGVFGASNFPFAFGVAGGDVASALAAGCPVVIKGHPAHPATSAQSARALLAAAESAGFPPGTVALVQGRGADVGKALVLATELKAIGFTGSLAAGRALFDLAAARPEPIPVYAEMGSLNPVFVLAGALATRPAAIAGQLVDAICLGAGQFCTKPGVIAITEGPGAEEFTSAVRELTRKARLGPLLNRQIVAGLQARVAAASAVDGVDVLAVGNSDHVAFAHHPLVLAVSGTTFLAAPALREELFGPVAMIVTCAGPEELIELARALPGSLTATIHAEEPDLAVARRLLPELTARAGRIVWNGVPTGVTVGHATHHGGPYPATTSSLHTSVGTAAIRRFLRPVAWQGVPDDLLPEALRDANPGRLVRLIDGQPSELPIDRFCGGSR